MTLFREAEYNLNCRLLGRYGSDEDDIEALRPLDLMTGFLEPDHETCLPCGAKFGDKFRRGRKYTYRLAEEWWERWLRRYPSVLQERQKWRSPQRNLHEGDFVLLIDDTTPPVGRYPYGMVTKTKKCADELVRSVTVRMVDGRLRERDVRKVVLLEAAENVPATNGQLSDVSNTFNSEMVEQDDQLQHIPLDDMTQ